ncbi:MAG: hypothetical protein ACYTEU_12505, partial [Planctomycetota bacterium]
SLYSGKHSLEIILVINNYAPNEPPPEAEEYRALGIEILLIPSARRPGVVAPLSARMHGVEVAVSDLVILFDADCRVPIATDLIDWYIQQFELGAKLAYTRVDYYELDDHWLIHFRIRVHHLARWVKRVPLRMPTSRGSNYAADRKMMLALYAEGYLADDLNVGRTFKSKGAKIAYSGAPNLKALTSGRMFSPKGFYQLYRYFKYRLRYNLKVLPVRRNADRYTGRDDEPMRSYVNGKPTTNPLPKFEEPEIE